MKRIFINPNDIDSSIIKGIAEFILDGKIVAIPTETVYGLAVCANNKKAVDKLCEIKNNSNTKAFTYAEDSVEEVINNYFITLSPFGYRLIERFWPGPLTIIYYSKNNTELAMRVPSHPVAREIIKAIEEGVYLLSANINSKEELNSADGIEKFFSDKLDLIIESDMSFSCGKPATIVDLTYKPFKILVEGAVLEREIIDVFIKKRFLFVCTGNTCRSPMAQFLFKKYLEEAKPYYKDRFEVISRGILSIDRVPISRAVADILREEENIDTENFRSKSLDREILLSSDLIFAMEKAQMSYILKIEPTVEGRLFHLKSFLPSNLEGDIPDPIGKSYETYKEVYHLIKKAILELKDWI